jgi:hypothetical protein
MLAAESTVDSGHRVIAAVTSVGCTSAVQELKAAAPAFRPNPDSLLDGGLVLIYS